MVTMTPVLFLCILLCSASAAPAEKENLPADVSEPQEEMMRMMIEEEEQELPEDLLPELIDGEESGNISLPAESENAEDPGARFYFCPPGWSRYNGFCYKFFNTYRTWYDAATYCNSHGSLLASGATSRQYSFLQQLAEFEDDKYPWLGGIYVQGEWVWADGQIFDYNGWLIQYGATSKSCLYLHTEPGWWNSECTRGRPFICVRQGGC